MSRAWRNGSSTRWRRIRAYVLDRDRWTCQLCYDPIPRGVPVEDPRAPQVHHMDGRAGGDNPARLVAAHRACNIAEGDPTDRPDDPQPTRRLKGW